jgi:hypothetical protein
MKFIPNILKKIETKSKHDLLKFVIGGIAGFIVEKMVENAYESVFEKNQEELVVSTES